MRTTYDDMAGGQFENERYSHRVIPSQFGPNSGFDVLEAKNAGDYSQHQDNWKFHLSVNPMDTPLAWDIVTNRLMETNYPQVAKVAKPDTADRFADPNSIQAGKQITIYTDKRVSPEKYKELLENIENDFREHGINPGPKTNADRAIPGSDYASYRAEKGANGEYVASSDLEGLSREQRFNPFNAKDPYTDFEISQKSTKLETKKIVSNESMEGVAKSGFREAVEFVTAGIDKVRSLISGNHTTVRDADWQPDKKSKEQNVAMVETSDMSPKELSKFKDELGNNGISFNTKSNESDTWSSIAVSDPNSLKRLKNYVQTGNPETTLAQSRSMDTTHSGLGM